MSEPPKTIYLQIDDGEVTWCADRINDSDVEYTRKDEPMTENRELQEALALARDARRAAQAFEEQLTVANARIAELEKDIGVLKQTGADNQKVLSSYEKTIREQTKRITALESENTRLREACALVRRTAKWAIYQMSSHPREAGR